MISDHKKQEILKDLHNVFEKHNLSIEASSYQLSCNRQTLDIYSGNDIVIELSDEGCCVINKESFL